MKVRKLQLLSLTCMLLPAVGFALMCLGAYMVSLQTADTWKTVALYGTMLLGLFVMLLGVFWNACYGMKRKTCQRRTPGRHVQIFTIERPNSFPPSYEESQRGQICACLHSDVTFHREEMSLAPPLYTQDSSEPLDCTWSREQPPQYSAVVLMEQRENVSPHQ